MTYKLLCTIILIIGIAIVGQAQAPSVLTSGLQLPIKIITVGQTQLLVAETGNFDNRGRISLVDRSTGSRQTLISGLPSSLNPVENCRSGPTGLNLRGLKLYVTIGQGDSVYRDGRGRLRPNNNAITPLNNSVLELTLPANYESEKTAFNLTLDDQVALAAGSSVVLTSQSEHPMVVRMVAKLPDHQQNNLPGLPQGNVRPANLFGITSTATDLYVVDASFNLLYRVNPETGANSVFANFAPVENPLPFGPPFAEPVPDNVRLYGDHLLVSQLTGFPFAPGAASIAVVDLADGSQESLLRNELTSAMDIIPVPLSGQHEAYYTLEFTTNLLQNPAPPGRLRLFVDDDVPVTVLGTLISPTSMARDGDTGDIFVVEIFPGRITRVPGTFDPMTAR